MFFRKMLAVVLAVLTFVSVGAMAEGATLVYGSGDYTRINPAIDEHGEINALIFNGLTAHDAENQVVPCLAKSWEYDAQTHTYTFYLEENVVFHDGEPFTAQDVKFTIETIQDPANESEIASNYEDVTSIEVFGDYTVAITLSDDNAAFLDYMTVAVLPEHLLAGEDMQTSDFFRFPIGTGPYRMEQWDEGQSITLVRNEQYFKGAPNIETIVFKIVDDDSARALQLMSGELDMAQVTPKDALLFEDDARFATMTMQTSDYRGILFNFQIEYWQKNRDLIPAVCCAIDRQAIVDAVLLGKGEVAYGPLQRNAYNEEDVEQYAYDPERAEQILIDAGCEKGEDGFYRRDGEKVGFVISCSAGDQVRIDMAQIAAQQLRAVGMDVTVEIPAQVDWNGQAAYLIGWGSPFDADDHTYKVFGTNKGSNYSGYSNSSVDEALVRARTTFDDAQRAEAYSDFQKALSEDPAFVFLCYIDANYVVSTSIHGISEDTVLGHHGVGLFWNVAEWTMD